MAIERTAIFDRTSITSIKSSYNTCVLCSCSNDCCGVEYSETQEYECMYANKNSNWELVEEQIWAARERSSLLRFIVDSSVPDRVLWAASYHALNVLQVNIDMQSYKEFLPELQHIMSMADNCGLYVVFYLYPIVPTLIRTYHVLEIIDNFRNSAHFHVNLGFCEIFNCIEKDDCVGYNNYPISKEYLCKTEDGIFVCTEDFKRKFLEKIQMYTLQRKLSVSICKDYTLENCTGIVRRNKN